MAGSGGAGGGGNRPPADDDDWLSALDEWDSQLDGALGGGEPSVPVTAGTVIDRVEPIRTESDLPALAAAGDSGAITLDEHEPAGEVAPLDEPPPLDETLSLRGFGMDLETAPQEALPGSSAGDDLLGDLFDGELAQQTVVVPALAREESVDAAYQDAAPEPAADRAEDEHDDFAEEGSTRVVDPSEIAPLLAGRASARAAASNVEDDEDDELEISVQISSALEQAAGVAEELAVAPLPPPPIDEDFYDDISIVPGRDEPSVPRASVAAPPIAAEAEDELWAEPPLVARSVDDPDRTPLPGAAEALAARAALRFYSTGELTQLPQRELVAARPERPVDLPALAALDVDGIAVTLTEMARRELLGLVDTERLLADGERAGVLAFEAASLCVRLGDAEGALERADAALRGVPDHLGALAIARRIALSRADLDTAAELMARELSLAAPRERRGLVELGTAIADRRGLHAEARGRFGALDAVAAPEAAGERFAALAFTGGAATASPSTVASSIGAELAAVIACRDCVSAATDARLAGALELLHARASERAAEAGAVDRYRAANAAEGRSLHAAFGLVRLGVRGSAAAIEREGLELLVEALPPSTLRSAVERQLVAALFVEGSDEVARARLAALADAGDEMSALLWSAERSAPAMADAELARMERALAITVDGGQRAALRFAIGMSEEARGHVAAAIASYTEASREHASDRRAERALERARSIGGDKQAELARQLRIAGTDNARAAWALVRAGALLLELGRGQEALERTLAALDRFPADGEGLALCAQLASALGQSAAAGERFSRAADASLDAAHAGVLRHRAAVFFAADGDATRALALVGEGRDPDAVADAARRLGIDAPAQLRELLGELAERATPASAWRAYVERASLAPTHSEAIEDLRRAVALRPAPAGVAALATRLLRTSDPAACALFLAERSEALAKLVGASAVAAGQREAAALDAALALSIDGENAAGAAALLVELLTSSDSVSARAELVRLARLRGRDPGLTASYDAALAVETSPERRAALFYGWARLLQRGGDPDRAQEKLRLAHEALPDALVYREALERAWERAGETARLADLALQDLKDAPDTRHKVLAYERLAFIDECLRGDGASARMSYESIAELDQNNHDAARRLERYLITERRGADLIHLYERMGLSASEPTVAVALTLERARLRRRIAGGLDAAELDAAIDNDLRLALFQEPRSRPALREAYARAVERRDATSRAELAERLAELCAATDPPDPRAASIFLVRAAEGLVQLGRDDDAVARLKDAVVRVDAHLPALVTLLDVALRKSYWSIATDAAEQIQRVQREPVARREAGLLAAALSTRELADRARAIRVLRAVVEVEPRGDLAYERLRALLTEVEDWAGLADVTAERIKVETDDHRRVALHVGLARVCRERLGDSVRARAELTTALALDATHLDAVALMADLEEAEGRWSQAADLLLRRAKAERQRAPLADILFRLGLIYARHLKDGKRAIACLTRVLQVDPNRRDALELIADAYAKDWDWQAALTALQRLASLEPDAAHRVELLHRAARIQEEGLKEPRQALAQYRAALELNPLHLPAVEGLAQFFDRHSDTQSLRVLIDTTARRLRTGLSGGPRDASAFRSLYRVFTMRRAPDRAAMAAGVLAWMGAVEPEEQQALDRLRSREQYPGSALADPATEEQLFDSRVPAGFRNLMRLVEEPLLKSFRGDVKQLGLQRGDRLPKSGHGVRDVGNRIATDLGIRDFDVYVSTALKRTAVLELTEPLSVCIGAELVEGAHELELRFLFARLFKMAQCRLALALRLTPEALAALVAGVVRQFVSDFHPVGVDLVHLAAEASRAQRALSKKLLSEVHPFALECAAPSAELLSISAGVAAAADRAGLIACGAPGPALAMLERMGMADAARALALFCVGEELPELRRVVGTSIG